MESTAENINKKLLAQFKGTGQIDLKETGTNKKVMKMMIDQYSYCITEDTVSDMHLALGKPHHAYQMNV